MRIFPYILTLLLFIIACASENNAENEQINDAKPVTTQAEELGLEVYNKYCKLCHGKDGALGLSGAANLAISLLNEEESIELIKKGRKGMTPYEGVLNETEIKAVANYIKTLKK